MSIAVKTDTGWQVLGVGGDGDCDLVGGVAGWAAIESVSGTADLATLQAAGIAPATATADNECPGTYNIAGDDGVVYRVAVWTSDSVGSVQTSGGIVDALLVGQGGCLGGGASAPGGGGEAQRVYLDVGTSETVTVGWDKTGGGAIAYEGWGDQSSLGDYWVSGGGQGQNRGNRSGNGFPPAGADMPGGGAAGPGTPTEPGPGLKDSITGVEIEYGRGGSNSYPISTNPGEGGRTGSPNGTGVPGIVVVRAPKDAEQPWEPAPELPGVGGWATITGIDGTAGTRYQYGDWVAYEWTENGSLTMQEGLVEFLVVGSGGKGAVASNNCSSGGGGAVNGGFEYSQSSSTYPIIIGKAGGGSKLGELHAAGGRSAGGSNATIAGASGNDNPSGPHGRAFGGGAGGSATRVASNGDNNMDGSVAGAGGIESSITGVTVSYGPGGGSWETPAGAGPWVPGQGGWGMSGTAWTNPTNGADGVVAIRVPKAHAYLGALPAGWVDA